MRILPLLLSLGSVVTLASSADAGSKRTVADMIADLKKGEKEQMQAIQELEALGDKAADAVSALVAVLEAKNEDVRLGATMALGKIGKASVEPLAKALTSKDSDVRFYAAWGLAFVGPPARSAAREVVKALADSSSDVRRKAAYALGLIDPDPEIVVDGLVNALADKDGDVRAAASAAIPKMGKVAVPALIKAMQGDSKELRDVAIDTLGGIGAAAASAVPHLEKILLKGESTGDADRAANALAGIGEPAIKVLMVAAADDQAFRRNLALRSLHKIGNPAVPFLVDLLGSKHVDVKRQVASLLGMMRVTDKMVVVGLGYALKDTDFELRRNALAALRGMGAGGRLAEAYIIPVLTDLDPQLRVDAFHTLQALGVDPKPGLKKALSHPDAAMRITTASLMVSLNIEVELAEPILIEAFKGKDVALKTQAATALSSRGLGADVVLPVFLEGLKDKNAAIRRQAVEGIARYGPKAGSTASALIDLLDDPDDSVRPQVMATLRAVGTDAKTLLPAMVKVLRGKDERLHPAAAQIFFQHGPSSVDDLVKMLKEEKAPGLRLVCIQVLATVGPPAKDAVPELIKGIDDASARNRITIIRALGNIGPDAKPAIVPLKTAAEKDGDENVRKIAMAALAQITRDSKDKEFVVHGVITPGDPPDRVRMGHFHVVHTFHMNKGQTYTIHMSGPFDTWLRLENSKGEQLAFDDDSGGGLNSQIVIAAPADGWYRIICTTFGGGAHGPYTLKVK